MNGRFTFFYWMLILTGILISCAPGPSQSTLADNAGKIAEESSISRHLLTGNLEKAQIAVNRLMLSENAADHEVATYWQIVVLLYRNEPDSAVKLLTAQKGKWTRGQRLVHSELLLRLAREASKARASTHTRTTNDKNALSEGILQVRIYDLQQENVQLRTEIARLEAERLKYQKLIRELEKIR